MVCSRQSEKVLTVTRVATFSLCAEQTTSVCMGMYGGVFNDNTPVLDEPFGCIGWILHY